MGAINPPYIHPASIRLAQLVTQSITSSGGGTKASFDTVSLTVDGWPATSAPVTDLTMLAGRALITLHDCDYGDGTTGQGAGNRAVFMRKNDATDSTRALYLESPTLSGTATRTAKGGSVMKSFGAGETLQFYIAQSSGSTLNVAINDVYIDYQEYGLFVIPQTGGGTAATTANSTAVVGTSTKWNTAGTKINVGDHIVIGGTERIVASISDDTDLVVTVAFPATLSGQTLYVTF